MIYGMIATSIVGYYLNTYYNGILIDYPIPEQLWDLSPYLMMAVLMGAAVYAVGLLPIPNLWSMLLVQMTIGVAIYAGLCRAVRLTAFMNVWQTGWNKITLMRAGFAR